MGHDEEHTYRAAGAEHVVTAGGLCRARNLALDMAEDWRLQLSDDLTKIARLTANGDAQAATLNDFLSEALTHITPNCRLVGVAPTPNAFYATHRVQRRHFVVGDAMLIAPTPLRFDEELALKEDYDYTCQHLMTYGEVARLDWWPFSFRHRTNRGGCYDYRTAEVEQESIAHLRSKWGSWIKPNPRRANEVLLRPR